MSTFVVNRRWARASYEDTEEMLHTAENGYQCDDPDCICHEAEEADYQLQVVFPGRPLASYYEPE
jgi:hypothetical protein